MKRSLEPIQTFGGQLSQVLKTEEMCIEESDSPAPFLQADFLDAL
jgi:hypothetical protein